MTNESSNAAMALQQFVFIRVHLWLPETNLSHAILEVIRSGNDFNFDAHEKNRQITAVDFREAHGVLLRGDDHFRLPLLAAIDGVQHLLLAEPVMIREPFG